MFFHKRTPDKPAQVRLPFDQRLPKKPTKYGHWLVKRGSRTYRGDRAMEIYYVELKGGIFPIYWYGGNDVTYGDKDTEDMLIERAHDLFEKIKREKRRKALRGEYR